MATQLRSEELEQLRINTSIQGLEEQILGGFLLSNTSETWKKLKELGERFINSPFDNSAQKKLVTLAQRLEQR